MCILIYNSEYIAEKQSIALSVFFQYQIPSKYQYSEFKKSELCTLYNGEIVTVNTAEGLFKYYIYLFNKCQRHSVTLLQLDKKGKPEGHNLQDILIKYLI